MIDLIVQKTFTSVVRVLSFDIAVRSDSRRVVLYGPSGAGKGLTLCAITGLMTPECGRIMLNDRTPFDHVSDINLSTQERRVGYLFQDYTLSDHLAVTQNIAFGLRHGQFSPPRHTHDPCVQQQVNMFELGNVAANFPMQISGDQRQRVALARAFIAELSMLLLDESFAALDPVLRVRIHSELSALRARL